MNLRISHLLTVQAAIGLLVAMVLLALSFWSVQTNDAATEKVYAAKDVTADILPPPMYLIEMRLALSQWFDGSIDAPQLQRDVQRLAAEYRVREAFWREHPPYGLEQHLLGRQHDAGQRFIGLATALAREAATRDPAALQEALKQAHAAYLDHRAGVDVTVAEAAAFSGASSQAAEAAKRRVAAVQLSLLALAVGMLVVVGWWVRQRIVRPIRKAVGVAERIAQGDLAQPVVVDSSGETGELLQALRRMQASLTGMVSEVRSASEQINQAAGEIAAGNHDLSMRTEQAASSLEETAASMEQINATVRNSADAARQANELATSAATVASRGGDIMLQAVTTMETIHQRSRQISDITGVIDSIAFQTNILALNAAVEAARAGEQGRGFAVVAGEVRNLAQRSAQAAKEIKQLIGASAESVDAGSHQVADAGRTMSDIVHSVQRVTHMIASITVASGEQSDGISQVSTAVNQLDQMTQQNAALVEQSAAAADSLRQQAARLEDLVGRFQVSLTSAAGS